MSPLPTPPRWAIPPLVAALAALVGALLAPGPGGVATASGRLTALDDRSASVAFARVEALVRDHPGELDISRGADAAGEPTVELQLSGPDPATLALTVNRVLGEVAADTDALLEPAVVEASPGGSERATWAVFAGLTGLIASAAVVTRPGRRAPATPRTPRSTLPVDHLYAETEPESEAAVAVHRLARSLLSRRTGDGPAAATLFRVVVAGTVPADRAAELAANLAIALAHQGVRVRLLDQDRATTAVADLLGIEPGHPGTIPLGGGRSVDCITIERHAPVPFAGSGARAAMDRWIDGFDVLVVHLAPRSLLDDVTRWSAVADAVLVARVEGRPVTPDDDWATDGTIPPTRHLGIAHQETVRT